MSQLPGLLPELEVIRKDFPILERVLAGGHRWSTSTARTPRRSRRWSSTRWSTTSSGTTPTSRAPCTSSAPRRRRRSRAARDKVARVHQRAQPRRGDLHQERLRGAQPGGEHAGVGRPATWSIGAGDEVVITEMEHHSNIVPWQLLTERKGATLRWFGLTDDGRLDLSNIDELINERTKVVSLTWVSNMLGTINPVAEIARARPRGRRDRRRRRLAGRAAAARRRASPPAPTCWPSPATRSSGPTGIGVLWGRRELLDQLPPFLGGGEMIETVRMERSTYAGIPHKFEAGTPPIVEAVGLGAAVDYLTRGRDGGDPRPRAGGHRLRARGPGHGARADRARPARRDAARAARSPSSSRACTRTTWPRCSTPAGIAVRAGHHCAKPAHARFGVQSSTRDVVVPLHHPGRDRRAGRGAGVHPCLLQGGLRVTNQDLDALYQEIILDHYKNPHHKGLREPFEAEVHHVNPTCGDEVTLRVHLDDGVGRGRVLRRRWAARSARPPRR